MKELHTIYMKMRCLMDILILKTLKIDEEKIINTIKDGPPLPTTIFQFT